MQKIKSVGSAPVPSEVGQNSFVSSSSTKQQLLILIKQQLRRITSNYTLIDELKTELALIDAGRLTSVQSKFAEAQRELRQLQEERDQLKRENELKRQAIQIKLQAESQFDLEVAHQHFKMMAKKNRKSVQLINENQKKLKLLHMQYCELEHKFYRLIELRAKKNDEGKAERGNEIEKEQSLAKSLQRKKQFLDARLQRRNRCLEQSKRELERVESQVYKHKLPALNQLISVRST